MSSTSLSRGALLLAVLSPLVIGLVLCLMPSSRGVTTAGDTALIELYTNHAAHASQLLGPWSRFEWHHPGPAYFYFLVPFYMLFGADACGLFFGALTLALCSLLLLLRLCDQLGSNSFFMSVALTIGCGVPLVLGGERLVSVWNPHAMLMPLLLLLFVAAGVASGRVAWLPGLAFVSSIVVQSNLSYTPPVIACVTGCLVLVVLTLRGMGAASIRQPLLWSLVVLVVVWLPPFVEQLQNGRGNLGHLLRFLTGPFTPHSLVDVLAVVARHFLVLPKVEDVANTGGASWILMVLAVVKIGLVGASAAVLLRKGEGFSARVAMLVVWVTVISTIGATRIRGNLSYYLFGWADVLGLLAWACLGHCVMVLCARMSRELGKRISVTWEHLQWGAAAVVTLVVVTGFLPQVLGKPLLHRYHNDKVDVLSRLLIDAIERGQTTAPRIRALRDWEVAAGVITQLSHRGFELSVEDSRLFMMGRQFFDPSFDLDEVMICDWAAAQQFQVDPNQTLLGRHKGTAVFLYRGATQPLPIESLRFGAQCQPYLRSGFSPSWEFNRRSKDSSRWANDRHASLMLPLRPQTSYSMVIRCRSTQFSGEPQRMSVSVNGQLLGVRTVPSSHNASIRLFLPAQLVRRVNELQLEFSGLADVAADGKGAFTGAREWRAVSFASLQLQPNPPPEQVPPRFRTSGAATHDS